MSANQGTLLLDYPNIDRTFTRLWWIAEEVTEIPWTEAPFEVHFDGCNKGVCKFTGSFHPEERGPFNATLSVNECPPDTGSCLDINIPMSGNGAKFATKPAAVDFGVVRSGTTGSAKFYRR